MIEKSERDGGREKRGEEGERERERLREGDIHVRSRFGFTPECKISVDSLDSRSGGSSSELGG